MKRANRRLTPEKPKSDFDWGWLRSAFNWLKKIVLVSVLVGVIGGAGFYFVEITKKFIHKPINQVVLHAKFNYVDQQVVSTLVEDIVGKSFIANDIYQAQKNLQEMPWVESVSLSRQWPDQLHISIAEQSPIARWGEEGFVNVRGELVLTDEINAIQSLPVLKAEADDVLSMLETYSVLKKTMSNYGVAIQVLDKNPRQVWKASLDNDWLLILGRGDILGKIQKLNLLLEKNIVDISENIRVIDMRYPSGIAIEKPLVTEIEEVTSEFIRG